MTWYPDLGTITMVDGGEHVRAVGWLSVKQQFSVGDMPRECLDRLHEFASRWRHSCRALGWPHFLGWHCCELCDGADGIGNFGVPNGDLLFVAPEMIGHYVEAHRYRPPAEFITALMESPLPGSDEYGIAVAPFRRLHEQYRVRQEQERVKLAAQWVREQGGGEMSISQACLRFFGDGSPEILERIRQALLGAGADRRCE